MQSGTNHEFVDCFRRIKQAQFGKTLKVQHDELNTWNNLENAHLNWNITKLKGCFIYEAGCIINEWEYSTTYDSRIPVNKSSYLDDEIKITII